MSYPLSQHPLPHQCKVGLCARAGPCLARQQHWDEDHVAVGRSAWRDGEDPRGAGGAARPRALH